MTILSYAMRVRKRTVNILVERLFFLSSFRILIVDRSMVTCDTPDHLWSFFANAGIISGPLFSRPDLFMLQFLNGHVHLGELLHLVVEQTSVLLDVGDVELLSDLEASLVVLAAERGSDVLDTRAAGTEDVVGEGEESITADSHLAELGGVGTSSKTRS
jgi:hypothetical protein